MSGMLHIAKDWRRSGSSIDDEYGKSSDMDSGLAAKIRASETMIVLWG